MVGALDDFGLQGTMAKGAPIFSARRRCQLARTRSGSKREADKRGGRSGQSWGCASTSCFRRSNGGAGCRQYRKCRALSASGKQAEFCPDRCSVFIRAAEVDHRVRSAARWCRLIAFSSAAETDTRHLNSNTVRDPDAESLVRGCRLRRYGGEMISAIAAWAFIRSPAFRSSGQGDVMMSCGTVYLDVILFRVPVSDCTGRARWRRVASALVPMTGAVIDAHAQLAVGASDTAGRQ